jgi:hypothetical protein
VGMRKVTLDRTGRKARWWMKLRKEHGWKADLEGGHLILLLCGMLDLRNKLKWFCLVSQGDRRLTSAADKARRLATVARQFSQGRKCSEQ